MSINGTEATLGEETSPLVQFCAFHSQVPEFQIWPTLSDKAASKELASNGVYRLAHGKLQLIVKDLTRPNGIAFSPDYKTLYVANSDDKRKVWMRYDVAGDGSVSNGRLFADVTAEKEDGVPDGMKVDSSPRARFHTE